MLLSTLRGGREIKRERTYVYLWLIHVDVWQKPTQQGKTIPPIKNKFQKWKGSNGNGLRTGPGIRGDEQGTHFGCKR